MARSTCLSLLALAAGAFAQTTHTFVDPMTDITFQAFSDNTTGYRFGIALPENPTTDFIGQLHAPLANSSGWVGADLGAPMINELLIVAYPSGNRVVSSFREATAYASPPVYHGNASVSMIPIAKGTSVTKNSLTYTFLCKGCITNSELSFSASDAGTVFGWALSDKAVASPSSPSSPLNFHNTGYGDYGVNLTMAKSAQYAQWAALATNSTGTGSTGTGSGAGYGSGTRPSSILAGSAIPSAFPSSALVASTAAAAPASASPTKSSCHKKGSKPQTGSVGAIPEPAENAQSVPSSAAAASPAAPTGASGSGSSGEGAGSGFPFGHHHHHHHHFNGSFPFPGFNGSEFGGASERPPRYHVGGGAARPRLPFDRRD